jgi:predicted RNase H-like HicB family nuclease
MSSENHLTDRYPAEVFWSDEDSGFIAVAVDLPGCSAFGCSQSEALAELQQAIEAWMQARVSTGEKVPSPSSRAAQSEFSGKMLVRMPRSLHQSLATAAERDGVSLNQHIVYLLTVSSTARATIEQISWPSGLEHVLERAHREKQIALNLGWDDRYSTWHFAADFDATRVASSSFSTVISRSFAPRRKAGANG